MLQVLSVSQIHGGNSYSTIPDAVTICGTFRAFKKRSFEILKQRIEQVRSRQLILNFLGSINPLAARLEEN